MADPKSTAELVRSRSAVLTLGNFTLKSTGLIVAGEPHFEEWEACGAWLRQIEGAVQFWIGDWVNYGEARWGEKYAQALEATGYDEGTLRNCAFVARNIQLSRRRDKLSFAAHSEIATLPTAKEQDAWLDRAESESMTRADLRTALRMEKRRTSIAAGDLPTGKFRVVYADPPWAYNDSGVIVSGDAYGRAERHYDTMSIDALCAMPVREHVTDDAVLFLWVTSPLLSACWPVIDAWGFEYKTSIVWDKRAHNFGHYVSVRHELLLICTRGSCTPDAPTPMPESVVAEKRTDEHSEKPERFRQIIDQLYPLGRRMELFGRREVPNWTVYGNQLSAASL